jgi:hypothetical protein
VNGPGRIGPKHWNHSISKPFSATAPPRFGAAGQYRIQRGKMRSPSPTACAWKAISKPALWPKRSNRPALPLSSIRSKVLKLLASHRDPESDVAGSTPLNRKEPRWSSYIDVFHDREERVAEAALSDAVFLESQGYLLDWQRREPNIYSVPTSLAGETTMLEWGDSPKDTKSLPGSSGFTGVASEV